MMIYFAKYVVSGEPSFESEGQEVSSNNTTFCYFHSFQLLNFAFNVISSSYNDIIYLY